MISFELPEAVKQQHAMSQMMAENLIRPVSRMYDEEEHEKPWAFIHTVWPVIQTMEMQWTWLLPEVTVMALFYRPLIVVLLGLLALATLFTRVQVWQLRMLLP